MTNITVPDLGDYQDAEVIEVYIKPGDHVELEAPLIAVETDKASIDIPATAAGTIASLAVAVGSKINQGDLIAVVEDGASAPQGEPAPQAEPAPVPAANPAATTLSVPDIGDFQDVEIIEVHVAAGAQVSKEDSLITLETDKASMDVPAIEAGTISRLLVAVGDRVSQGSPIAELVAAPAAQTASAPAVPAPAAPVPAAPAPAAAQAVTIGVPDIGDFQDVEIIEVHVRPDQQIANEDSLVTLETDKASMDVPSTAAGTVTKVLVTVGDKVSQGSPIVEVLAVAAAPAPAAPAPAPAAPQPALAPVPAPAPTPAAGKAGGKIVHASPAVRKLAREYGVTVSEVPGSGRHGRILKEDIQAYVKQRLSTEAAAPSATPGGYTYKLPELNEEDYSQFGPVEQVALPRVKLISGPVLHRNWMSVPHVTQFDEADVTDLENFRKMNAESAKAKGFSLSPLAFLVKAVTSTLTAFPEFNSSLALDGKSLYLKKYYNIGIAVNTPGGLLVPVVKDAAHKPVMQIAQETAELSARTRAGKAGPADLRGGTFTISSLGGLGGTHFTPIVNAPEVAILGVGRSRQQPVWTGQSFEPRLMMPLALSYDHRAIDGALGAQFITHLGSLLSDLRKLAL